MIFISLHLLAIAAIVGAGIALCRFSFAKYTLGQLLAAKAVDYLGHDITLTLSPAS